MSMVVAVVKLIRPKQWIKNLFVLAPLIFAKELFEAGPLISSFKAFAAFCFAASAVYVMNDIVDVDADRAHPEKKYRPIAAGTISPRQAVVMLLFFAVIAVILAIGMDQRFQFIIAMYFFMNLAYSFKLKEVVLLDVFTIAAGFMMRVLAGAYAIDVRVSTWIVLCTLFLSLFLGFAKRRGEILHFRKGDSRSERKVLYDYKVGYLDQMLTISAAGTVISYALYTMAPRTIEVFGTEKMIYTTVFVLFGMFRYLYLVHMTESTENPTNAVTSDWPIIVTTFLWAISCILLIYSGGHIPGFSK